MEEDGQNELSEKQGGGLPLSYYHCPKEFFTALFPFFLVTKTDSGVSLLHITEPDGMRDTHTETETEKESFLSTLPLGLWFHFLFSRASFSPSV